MPSDALRNQTAVAVITSSFRADYELCRLLCESIDRFAPPETSHLLVVPKEDLTLFSCFASPTRTIVAEETLLPAWLKKLPMPSPDWRRMLGLSHRNFYWTPYGWPVRGWIVQQIIKIAAASAGSADILVHMDSDTIFIRPFTLSHLVRDGRVRLFRNPDRVPYENHRRWQAAAGRLLGLPPSNFYGGEYVDSCVVWRRSVLLAMIKHIESVAERDWRIVLTRTPHFSEYTLYGVYADRVAGFESAGLYAERSLCHTRWVDFTDNETEADFIAALEPEHIACCIQSTIPMSLERRRRILEQVSRKAFEQDRREIKVPLAVS